uniref:Uncharacterized protein n=1 Tax=Bosea sp. NBC_00436 TaxID=2969620 RepID=A0A9E7ZVL0_9HYPH
MSPAPKSFKEFALEGKAAQRRYIREERDRMKKALVIWEEADQKFEQLGLRSMTNREIAQRLIELDEMTSEIDEEFGDNEVMRASYAAHLRLNAQD